MKIIIVDGSDSDDDCYRYVESLESENTIPIQVGYNIGHGRGMCLGLHYTKTPYVLFFDSDIEMFKSPVAGMLEMMDENTFGVGYIEPVGLDGFNYGVHPNHINEPAIKYLHPYFQLIQVKEYQKFYPYVHHGAPCFLTMLQIYKMGLSDKILKDFPGLGHSAGKGATWVGEPRVYIRHDVSGTRTPRRESNLKEIEGIWEYYKGQI
jgi:hypothetical protein